MKHLKFLILVIICLISFSVASQTETKKVSNAKIEGSFVHTVLFWLNNPESKKDRTTFENGVTTLLNQCKFITASHMGVPANTAKRPVVDASYTYFLVITFESKEAHDKYQIDPIHKNFVEKNKNLWNKVLVYDSESL